MATVLKSVVEFVNVPVGATQAAPHGLNWSGRAVRPDVAWPSAGGFDLAFDEINVTVTNNGDAPSDIEVLVESWHTFDRCFGTQGQQNLRPDTFVPAVTGFVTAGSPAANSITAPAVTATTPEDQAVVGNVLADATTTQGTLIVQQFTVAPIPGGDPAQIYAAGSQITIAARGTFVMYPDGEWSFTPLADYHGAVPVITFQITNGTDVRVATLTITVTPVNDPPVANDDARITLVNTPITINVLANDQDPDGDPITVTQLDGAPVQLGVPVAIADGTVEWQGGGDFLVTPDNDFTGTLSFQYTATDGTATDTGTVTVLVGAANEPMISAASPAAPGDPVYDFGLTFLGRYGNAWGNGVNVTIPPYSAAQGLFDLNNREPWLYDRATTAYALYRRTQDDSIRDEAIALADLYMAGVEIASPNLGRFIVLGGAPGADPTDIKYLYPIIGVWYEQLTGSSVHRAKSLALYNQALLSFSKTYSPTSAALWTERNCGYAIQASVSAYWLHWNAGNRAAAATALADAWDYVTMIEGMAAATGAPLHGHNQHEGSAITTPITSPWMAAFLAESLLQLYRTDPDPRVPTWLSTYGDFLIANAFYVTDGSEHAPLAGLRLPAYLVADGGTPTLFREGELLDMEHAQDVASLIKKVIWAKTVLAQPTAAFDTLLAELEQAADEVFLYWTRETEGYPRYRVNPPRKYAWWFRNDYSQQSLFFTEQVPARPLSITTVSISGSTQSGSLLTATPGTWDGSPAPALTYQWLRDGVAIAGATNSTYTTQVADEGTTVTCRETATNSAGAASLVSNGLAIVPAGAPEITQHPVNASAEVGQTAQFTAQCDAAPAADFQWQVSTDGGGSWNNVAEGTGGSGTGNNTTYTTEVLAGDDDGDRYRCVFTNAAGSSTTNPATLSMVVDQGAARFTSNDTYAVLSHALGTAGQADMVIETLVYFEGRSSNAAFFGAQHSGNGRALGIRCNNTFEVYDIGPFTQPGGGITVFGDQPPENTWLFMAIQVHPNSGGTPRQIRATWTTAEGAAGTIYAQTHANGVEDSVQAEQVFLGGLIGQPGQAAVRFQYVRGRTGYLDDAAVATHRQAIDTSPWEFWLRFFNDGGNLGVEDKTGNNRVPVLTGGTFVAGPVVPSVP